MDPSLMIVVVLGMTGVSFADVPFCDRMKPVPETAKFSDPDFFIWGASMVQDKEGLCHLFYSRWPRKLGHNAWVTHSEIAHATSANPLGPFKHVDVALPARGKGIWDGLSHEICLSGSLACFDDVPKKRIFSIRTTAE